MDIFSRIGSSFHVPNSTQNAADKVNYGEDTVTEECLGSENQRHTLAYSMQFMKLLLMRLGSAFPTKDSISRQNYPLLVR